MVDSTLTFPGRTNVIIPYVQQAALEELDWQAHGKSRLLFFMTGHCRSPLRQRLLSQFHDLQVAGRTDIMTGANECPGLPPIPTRFYEPGAYLSEVARSEFCLVLPGDTASSRRDTEVAMAGCIPVMVGRTGPGIDPLPLESFVKYDNFTVKLPAEVTAGEILVTISAIPQSTRTQMREDMRLEVRKLDLRRPEGAEVAIREICSAIGKSNTETKPF